jgi:hypothetical protein
MLSFIRWLFAVMMAGLLAASQVGPGAAVSNLAKWADLIGIHPVPLILKTKQIDQWVAIGAALVLLAIAFSWVMEYQILRGYVRQHGGDAAFASVAPKRRAAIVTSLLASILILAVVGLFGYFRISQPYQLSDENAYLRVVAVVPIYPTPSNHVLAVHFFQRSAGGQTATSALHTNDTSRFADNELSDDDIDGDFVKIETNLQNDLKTKRGATLEVGDESYWTYVWSNGDVIIPQIETGKKRLYIYWVSLYKDKLIPPDLYIATEACVFIMPTHAVARCTSHNGRSLIR